MPQVESVEMLTYAFYFHESTEKHCFHFDWSIALFESMVLKCVLLCSMAFFK